MARSRRARQAVIQAYKRLPFSPPRPLRAPLRPNAKALALALSGYSQPAGATLPEAERMLAELPGRIDGLRLSPSPESAAWGYHFSVQTRHLFYSDRSPNAIATCFVVEALLEAADATGKAAHAELALMARPYLVSLFQPASGASGPYFAYVASGSQLIHNANLLVCAALARLERLDPDPGAAELAIEAARTSLAAQRDDGLWPYGAARNLSWVDNLHTAYVLDSLYVIGAEHGLGGAEARVGLDAWIDRFFEPDGAARYFPDRRFPLEAHSYASAIDTLCGAAAHDGGRRGELLDLARRVAASAVRELWLDGEDRFGFRRGRVLSNRRAFMRWTNAPMFRALSRLASALPERSVGGCD